MRMIQWTTKLSVGVEELDADHRQLIEILNRIFGASYAGVGDEVLCETMRELIDYTRYHFTREEGFLEEHGYPELTGHRRQHNELLDELEKIDQRIRTSRQPGLEAEVLKFLNGWLISHIKGFDFRYSDYLRQQGAIQ